MKKTIYDVAREAGVSIATVSKVINNTGRISDKTRRKITSIMQEMNYQPSVVASALTGKGTYTIGLLIPDIANPFFAEIARSVEDRSHDLGFNLVICNTDNDPDKESQYISLLKQKSADGIIVATGVRNDELLKTLIRHNVAIALIAREMPTLAAHTVLVDDFNGGYLATAHLTALHHRRIGVIVEDLSLMSSKERLRGYRHALSEAGLAYDDNLVGVTSFNVESSREAAGRLLGGPEPPSAIFACNDLLAIGAIQAARQRGLVIPEQLSVVGFDNTILATITDPPLTTVAQPIASLGAQVVDLITQQITGIQQTIQRIVLQPELVVRSSTTEASL
jgi:DNA-binding LacI/PurR family transcriptional regulator